VSNDLLLRLVAGGGVVVLSGAGLSTESGIPDYRGPTGLLRRAQPMTYQAFSASAEARQRYWARSHAGWSQIASASPNTGHLAVAELERSGLIRAVITQNVDGLHQAAGSQAVVELHGGLDRVRCLSCGERSSRLALDHRLRAANPGWDATAEAINPDGDAALDDELVSRFAVVDCDGCGGILKPDVIFFGENVPRHRVAQCFALVEGASVVLVLGSSLTVQSGYRFVRRATALGVPVAIINQGPTRGDAEAVLVLDAPLGSALTSLTAGLSFQSSSGTSSPTIMPPPRLQLR
jgi:NAD-dependent SIR2 family protein deacetylase